MSAGLSEIEERVTLTESWLGGWGETSMEMESVKADEPLKGLPVKRSKRTVTGVKHEIKIKREGEWKEEEQEKRRIYNREKGRKGRIYLK